MTKKERILLRLMASGMGLEKAAEGAGYNLAYATKKAGEPAFLAALDATRQPGKRRKKKKSLQEIVLEMIEDETLTPSERLAAIKAFIYLDEHAPREWKPPTIIDDVFMCARCEWRKHGEGRAPEGDQGLPEDRQPGEEPGTGSGDPAATAFR